MKKTRLFVFAAMLAAASVSCQKDENFESQSQPEQSEVAIIPFELSARTENSEMPTRLSLGKELKPAWEEGDQLGVYDGVKIQQFDLTDLETSTFTGSLAEGATQLNAIYPYGAATAFAGGKFTASIPAEQVIEQGDSLATGALLAMAHPVDIGDDKVQFAFKNVCGLIRFEISKAGQVKEFIITGNKGEKFAGEGVIGFETRIENEVEKQVPVFAPSENAATVVKVRPAGENATFAKGTYYAAVAPVTFAEGFSVTLLTVNDAATVSKGTEKEMTVPRNSGMGLRDLVSIAEWDWKIYTVEQLLAWNAAPTSTNHRVELMADLDMTGVEWTPKTFQGVFEGNDHKIYNFTINRNGHCGFVEYLNKDAVIRNLILGSKDGENYDGVSKFTYTPGETAGSWVHVGSVAAKVDGNSLLENVTNFIHLETPDSEGTAKVCMGGITSMGASKETIRNCVNYGNVTCNASKGAVTGASNHQLGGIISKTDGSTQVIGCKNYGTITAGGAYVDNIGGIIANPNGNSTDKGENKPLINDCYNYGNILVTKAVSDAKATPMALGGIVGKLTGATVENCHNQGNISSVCDVLTGIGGVVGIHALAFESKITNCSNGKQNDQTKGLFGFAPSTSTSVLRVGGVLGYSQDYTGKLTIMSSTNYAPISLSYANTRYVGGICGMIGKDSAVSTIDLLVKDCHNHGAVNISGTGVSGTNVNFAGIIGLLNGSSVEGETVSCTVEECTNNALITSSLTGCNETRISGLVGYTEHGTVNLKSCTNNSTIQTTGKASKPRLAGMVAVSKSGTLNLESCYNKGDILKASDNGNDYIGGILGYAAATSSLYNCHNEKSIKIKSPVSEINMGGVVGSLRGGSIQMSECTNGGSLEAPSNGKGAMRIGGIMGWSTHTGKIEKSKNLATADITLTLNYVNSSTKYACFVGGVIGGVEKELNIDLCENSGSISLDYKGIHYICVGGIIGQASTNTVSSCKNNSTGTILATVSKSANQLIAVGGIVGEPKKGVTITGNTNYATITGENTHTAPRMYVGGIFGSDSENSTGAISVQNNINYGAIVASTTSSATVNKQYTSYGTGLPGIGAGGLFGLCGFSSEIADTNVNYGNVSATSAGTAAAAGALAGISNIKTAWSGKVCKTVTVNGGLGAETAPANDWVCPVYPEGYAASATYVDAPVAQ